MNDAIASLPDRREGAGKLYVQVASLLRRNIRDGIWQAGQRLPSLESLAKEYDVSIVTLRQAVILLGDEGLLRRVQGKGTYVARTAGVREWLHLATTWEGIQKFYKSAEAKLANETLSVVKNTALPENLQVGSDCAKVKIYRYMRRVHSIDGLPYAVSDVYLDESIFQISPEKFKKDFALKIIEALRPPVAAKSFQTLLIGNANAEIADNINVQIGSSIAEIHRSISDFSNRLIYYSVMCYRGDLIQIRSQLK
jgi:GntR family transcriptional regulator